jgi:hypothetical protein
MSPSGFTINLGGKTGRRGAMLSVIIGAVMFAVANTVVFWDATGEIRRWETPCTFTESRIVEKDISKKGDVFYKLQVSYTYNAGGETHIGHAIKDPRYYGSRDREEAEALAAKYPEGGKGVCYVSWFDSTNAVLEKPDRFTWIFFAFPFVPLVLIVLVLIVGAVWRRARGKVPAASPDAKPLTQKKAGKQAVGTGCLVLFFGIFFLMGSVIFFLLFIRPVYRIATSDDWVQVPCTIVSSEVGSHSDSDGTTYSINITYSYEYEGRTYQSDDYNFMGGSSSGRSGKEQVVRRYPAGSERVCYVNPKDPNQAVLSRDLSWEFLFGLIPLVFVIVGGGGIYFVVRSIRKAKTGLAERTRTIEARPGAQIGREASAPSRVVSVPAEAEWLPKKAREYAAERGPVQLKPSSSPWKKVIGMLVFSLIWNGVVSLFVQEAIKSWQSGDPEWGLTIFLIPFVLIGIGTIYAVFHFLLATFNPRPTISVSSRTVPLGGAMEVEWLFEGNIQRLESLRIYLEGREEARYRRGTNTYTDQETFTDIDIVSTSDMATISRGGMVIAIPDTTMHSFEASNNKIIWTLKLHGSIRRWPDVKSDYEIVVLPAEQTEVTES